MKRVWLFLTVSWLILSFAAQALCSECLKAKTWYHKGLALSNNSLQEITYYQKAIELCPEYAAVHMQLGNIYKVRQELDLAIKELQLACAQTNLSEPHTSLGEIYRQQGQYNLAIKEFQTALDINPQSKRALSNLEYIYRISGRYDNEYENPSLVPIPIFGREPGFTLPIGNTMIDLQLESLQIKRYKNQGDETINIGKFVLGIRYGLTNNLTLGIIPKLFWKRAYILRSSLYTGEQREFQPSIYGLGDTMVLLKYCLWYRKKTSLAASLNVSIPTGDEKKTARYADKDFTIPLGSGKYEFMSSLAFSTNFQNLGYLHTNLHYFFHRKQKKAFSIGYEDPGDELRYNVAFCRPVSVVGTPYLFSLPITGMVAQIELNGVYKTESKEYSKDDEGNEIFSNIAGGNTLFLSPGAQLLFYPNLKLELGVQFPISIPEKPWIKKAVFHLGFVKSI